MRLHLEEREKACLFHDVHSAMESMRLDLAEGMKVSTRQLFLGTGPTLFFYRSTARGVAGYAALLRIRLTKKQGFTMYSYSGLACEGTELWDIVRAAILEEGK